MTKAFPGGSGGKESACNVGDLGSIFGSGRSPREGNGYSLQYSCLENPQTEEPVRIQSISLQESDATERLSVFSLFCGIGHVLRGSDCIWW